MHKLKTGGSSGQALVEYILVFAFMTIITLRFSSTISGFFGDSFGNLNRIISLHLTTGVCERQCFSKDYSNGFLPGGP